MEKSILPDGWTIQEVRQRAQDDTVEVLDPCTPVFHAPREPDQSAPLDVDVIIGFTGLCLAHLVANGEWYMGHRVEPGEPIYCWSSYGADLGAAIDGL
ncbi:hypothetical protein [Nocardia suismassiliense]|uniref:hypothetical protein n=1 Tax=Nocardia suismassiliense TaxID=2077092 RepID=UPI00131F1F99|nr:hypothetical protein [Nocardia suismassiliense]